MSILKYDDKYTHITCLSILILCLSLSSSMTRTYRSNNNRLRGRQPSPTILGLARWHYRSLPCVACGAELIIISLWRGELSLHARGGGTT